MKKLLLGLLLVISVGGYAQISWNAKVGTNLSKQTQSNVDMKLGYQLGIGMDYYFSDHWGIQPSFMLISKGFKSKGTYLEAPGENNPATKFNITDNRIYLEMPIMLAYRFEISQKFKMVLNGGGYLSYGIAGKYKNKFTQKDGTINIFSKNTFSYGTERFDVGLGGGTTLEYLNRYTIGIIGEWGLKKALGDAKNQSYGINIGYKF